MDSEKSAGILLMTLLVLMGIFLLMKAVLFFRQFAKDIRYFTMEMGRAENDSEYRYWRRARRCHYLYLVPFVTKKNVLWVYHRLYHRPRHAAKEPESKSVLAVLAPSFLGLVLSAVCLSGASWAWFTGTQSNRVAPVQAARFSVEITAMYEESEESPAVAPQADGSFVLCGDENKGYRVALVAEGTATVGYCAVTVGETTYHTPNMAPGDTVAFAVSGGTVRIVPQWGSYSGVADLRADAVLPAAQAAANQTVAATPLPTTAPVSSKATTTTTTAKTTATTTPVLSTSVTTTAIGSNSGAAKGAETVATTALTTTSDAPTESLVATGSTAEFAGESTDAVSPSR